MRTFTQKLAFLVLALFCCVGLQVKAEELTVADGTATNSYLPIYGNYLDADDCRGQCLYPADLLDDMAGGTISKLTFYLSSPASAAWTSTIHVSLGETSETSLSSSFITEGLTEVFVGTLDATQTILEVEFDNPITYNGENLVVDFYSPNAGNYKSASFYGISQDVSDLGRYGYDYYGYYSSSSQNFLPKVTFEYEAGSGGATCAKPSLVTSDTTAHGITLTWGDGSGTYNVEYKAAEDADWTSVLAGTNLLTATLSNLLPNTSYQARVQSVCPDTVSGWKSVNFKTLIGIPYLETFSTSSQPAGWSQYQGLLADVMAGTGSLTSGSAWSFGASNGVFDSHARINSYSTKKHWLVAPAIPIESDVQLTFDLALTAFSGTLAPPAAQPNARLVVLATTDNGATWTILREWNNTDSEDVFNDIACSATGQEVVISLDAFVDMTVQIAFYHEMSGSGDNNLHIDNVQINKIPTCFKPTELGVKSLTKNSAEISWLANTGESAWRLQYKKSADSGWQTPIDITSNPYTLTGLETFTAYDVRIAAVCGEEEASDYSQVLSFKTAAGIPYKESFNSSFNYTYMSSDWSRYSGSLAGIEEATDSLVATTSGWATSSTTNGVFPDSSYHAILNITGANCHYWMVSPIIEVEDNVQLTFDMALTKASGTLQPVVGGEQDSAKFVVLITTDGGESWEKFEDPGTWDNVSTAEAFDRISSSANGQMVAINLSAYAGQSVQIAFYGEAGSQDASNNLHISNVKVDYIPSCEKPTEISVIGVTKTSASLTWDAGSASAWVIQYSKNANFSDSVEVEVSGNAEYELTGLTPEVKHFARVKAVCGVGDESEWSSTVNFFPTNAIFTTINEGTISNRYTPIFGYYADDYSRSQFVIPAAELVELQWDTITKLTFYASNTNLSWGIAQFEVYMGIAQAETIDVLTDWSSLTKVKNAGSLSIADGEMVVSFDAPYQYQGGNLLIGINQTVSGSFSESYWIGKEATGASLGGYGNSVAQQDFLPKMTIAHIPGEEPACIKPANLVADSTTTNSVLLAWESQGSESNWLIRYKKASEKDWTELDAPVQSKPYRLSGLDASSIYNVKIAAWCNPADSATISDFADAISFATECETVTSFPWSENFDGISAVVSGNDRVLPLCWSAINTSTSEDYSIYPTLLEAANASKSEPNILLFYSYCSSSYDYDPQDQYAILPEMEGVNGLRIRLSARRNGASNDGTFIVGVMSNPDSASTFVPVDTLSPETTQYEDYTILLDSYEGAGKYIAIKLPAANTTYSNSYRTVIVDNIIVDEIPTCFEPDSLHAVLTSGNGTIATLKWAAGEANAWVLQYSRNANFSDSVEVALNVPSYDATGLTPEATYYARVKGICDVDDESDWSVISFVPTNAVIINDSTATNEYVPIYGYYADEYTRSQFIIPAAELEALAWDSINKITFFSSSNNLSWGAAQFEVYLSEVPATTISSAAAWSSMNKVKSAGSLSIVNGEMVVAFDAPYSYEGGNLLVGFKQTTAGSYNNVAWYGKNVPGASIGGYGSNASSTGTLNQQNFLPKMKIGYIEGAEPTCWKVKNLVVSERTASSAKLAWTKGDENQSAWQVAIDTLANFNPDTAALFEAVDTFYTFTGLAEQKTYYAYVRANCGAEDGVSAWSARASFATTSACEKPTNVKADSITTTSALISWETYGLDAFYLRYRKNGTTAYDTLSGNCPIRLEGLTPATIYQVQVKAACDTTNLASAWTTAIRFTTDCEAIVAYPWTTNFDSITGSQYSHVLPICWDYINTSTYSSYNIYPSVYSDGSYSVYSKTAPNSLRFYSSYSSYSDYDPQDQYVILPEMEGISSLRIKLNARAYSSSNDATFTVGVMSNPADTATFEPVAAKTPATTSYTEYVVSFGGYNGIGKHIAIKMAAADASSTTRGLYIDDITVDSIPNCIDVSDIEISGRTAHSAVIKWTNGAEDQNAWQIALGDTVTFNPDEVLALIDADSNPFTLNDLDAETKYYLYVRTNCGGGEYSAWSKIASFRTVKECETPTDLVQDTATLTSATISWETYGHTSFNLRYAKANETEWVDTTNISMPFTLTDLRPSTLYRVQVQPVCDTLWSNALTVRTLNGVPFEENFDAASKPASWSMYTGQLMADTTAALAPASYGWSFGTNNNVFDSHAYSNIYGTGCFRWLVTPSIELSDSAQLTFDLALTVYSSGSSAAPTAGGQPDDKFVVLISTDKGDSWSILREWNNMGSEYVYDNITNAAAGQPVTIDLRAYTGQSAIIAFYGESTQSNGDNNIHVDNVVIDIWSNCFKPSGLKADRIAANEAAFSWDAEEGDEWQYYYTLADATPNDSLFISLDTNAVVIDSLSEMTDYVFYLRKDCGNEKSQTISKSFTTIQHPASLPFADDFEDGNKWLLINGEMENAWVVDTAAHNGAGSHALYISNDGGLHNTYTVTSPAVSYATKAITIEEDGKYIIQYDWRCVGEVSYGSIYDYMRVLLAPASAELTAGSLVSGLSTTAVPEGWIALDGEAALHSSAEWQKKSVTATIQAGLYKIVVLWKDDSSSGTQTPAAIDNFSIVQKPCVQPSDLAASNITPRSATISWTKGSEDQNAWQLAISTQEGFDPDEINPIIALSNLYELAELNAETTYYLYVRANCGEGEYSAWSTVYSFATLPMCTVLGEPVDTTICAGDAYTWRGHAYSETGIYYDTLISVAGCDSILSLELTVAPAQDTLSIIADKDTICPGDIFEWNGHEYTEAGLYSVTLTSIYGCDSIAKLELSVYDAEDTIRVAVTIKEDELPYTYENADHPYIAGEDAITFPEGTSVGEHKATAYVEGGHCGAVLELTLTIEKSQGIDNIVGSDGKNVHKVLYHDVLYIVINDEWYSTDGKKVNKPE